MAESNNGSLHSLHAALDPKSLLLSHLSDSNSLQLTTETFILERGPRYNEYSDLRNKRLRSKTINAEKDEKLILTPPRKQVKFSSSNLATPPRQAKRLVSSSSVVAQSVPDFSALRKENRKPSVTPPAALKSGKMYGKLGGAGSKSANSGGNRGGMMTRKSYANVEEMKSLSVAARNSIVNGGRLGNGGGSKTILGSRRF